jgi:hypothetical protein
MDKYSPDFQRKTRIVADINSRTRNSFFDRFVDGDKSLTLYLEGFMCYMLTLSESEADELRGKIVRARVLAENNYNLEFGKDLYTLDRAQLELKWDWEPEGKA